MQLKHGCHLAYCTNVHPGETWDETLAALDRWTLAIKEQVCPCGDYGIGLRLSDRASRDLSDTAVLSGFQRWLDKHGCYVFTINGFPFGQFHGTQIKERVYLPDWTDPQRLEYTNRLFNLLAQLVPPGIEGSVSTLPGSFKEFIRTPEQHQAIRENVWKCLEHIARTSERTGRRLHLGLEPEPLGLFENSVETVEFFNELREEHADDPRLENHSGVNYDACHFAIQFEKPEDAIARFQKHNIRLSKLHISNAIKLRSSAAALARLAEFEDEVYLHQVVVRSEDGSLHRFKDLDLALAHTMDRKISSGAEWRVHFHVPLHWKPAEHLDTTADHVLGLLKLLQAQPQLCSHLEMETYTWAVLPETLKSKDVTDQIVSEYRWMIGQLKEHGFVS